MSKTVLAEVEGFTPLMDIVVQEVGLISAAVFGRMWRYCQMKDGVCKASLDRIASEIGMSRKTVQRHAKALCEAGYLQDRTPGLRNEPHIYADTGKVQLQIAARATVSGRSESPTSDEEVGQKVHSYGQKVHLGRSESPMKIQEETEKKQQQAVVAFSQSSSLSPKQQASYATLVATGVSEEAAKRIAEKVEPVRVQEVCLAATLKEGITDKAGWIVSALSNGWAVRAPGNDEKPRTDQDRALAAGQFRVRDPRTGEWYTP